MKIIVCRPSSHLLLLSCVVSISRTITQCHGFISSSSISSHSSSSPFAFVSTRNNPSTTFHTFNNIKQTNYRFRHSNVLFQSQTSTPPSSSSSSSSSSSVPHYHIQQQPEVAKTGGKGDISSSQLSIEKDLNLGSPQGRPSGGHYLTRGGVQITSHMVPLEYSKLNSDGSTTTSTTSTTSTSTSSSMEPGNDSASKIEELIDRLDKERGVLLSSSYEFPGRYKRWCMGFVNPPLEISGSGNDCSIVALNDRGKVMIPAAIRAMEQLVKEHILESVTFEYEDGDFDGEVVKVHVKVKAMSEVGSFNEEDRSRQPSLFSVVRALVDAFGYESFDQQFGLYGAFGYDLTFQFEPITIHQQRDPTQRDLLLYLPDEILVVDQDRNNAWIQSYDFAVDNRSTQGLPRTGSIQPFIHYEDHPQNQNTEFQSRDTPQKEFASSVEKAKEQFSVGNLFEVVLSQTFRHQLTKEQQTQPSTLYRRLRERNPSPYGFFINLGEDEYLVGASPEMFVRCQQTCDDNLIRVETCPISGTVARGSNALEDAKRVKSLIINSKEESELTMCTDVDRNDKSRICIPGSVKVIGRRQIEMYSRLIHTVDHVEGYLRKEFDALDAFLCHTWAVTVTGAPKTWAIQFVEEMERSPRCWYGGAVGMVGFDGGLNTGLTLRTVRIKNGVAEVRAGATLLYDSSPEAEELETELKASAMIDAIIASGPEDGTSTSSTLEEIKVKVGDGKKVILIDHEDSFVHTLGNYLRQTGADVITLRSGKTALDAIETMAKNGNAPDLVVLSPGPGNPSDFGLSQSIALLTKYNIPGFGVCLGLQGMVEHFGGKLGVLGYPMHGKPSKVNLTSHGTLEQSIFATLPETFEVARYHSLYGIEEEMPDDLLVTAKSEDGIVMGIRHKELPFAAVQFHPESILTNPQHGMTILENALLYLQKRNN